MSTDESVIHFMTGERRRCLAVILRNGEDVLADWHLCMLNRTPRKIAPLP